MPIVDMTPKFIVYRKWLKDTTTKETLTLSHFENEPNLTA